MDNIATIDKNFVVAPTINKPDAVFFDTKKPPFSVHGLIREDDRWVRMPDAIAATVNEGVHRLSHDTAGGRVRFRTNSPYVAIKTMQPKWGAMTHMAGTGQMGFDLYVGDGKDAMHVRTFVPSATIKEDEGYESVMDIPGGDSVKTVTINMPLYYCVSELYVGVKEGSIVERAPDYSITRPIVYYGSSITQGGCASRPGNSYQGFLSRWLDADHVNLGFSGSACGEMEMASYIATLDMSAFVLDYDFNTPSLEHLVATHEPFFKRIREAQPDLPIIIMTRPFKQKCPDARVDVIRKTYENAKQAGDENVYFIHGAELYRICGGEGTVDGTHPTDFGFYSMAKTVYEVLKDLV